MLNLKSGINMNTILYLALTLVICALIYLIVVVTWIYKTAPKTCVCCGKIIKRCKNKYYIDTAGQLCKKCYKLIYE